MGVDSLARRLAAAALQKGEGEVTKDYVDSELAKKYDKTGGPISGDVTIQGDLTVTGTTTTEKEKQLLVEDNVIATNANKIDLKALLSGLAINKNADATYGIMYDPTDDTVKFGEGILDSDNKFVFKEGEGHPLAIRADSASFTDAHLVRWDANLMGFVDAGVAVNSLSKKIKSLDLSYGAQVVTYDTTDGLNIRSQARITYVDDTTDDVNDEIEIPIVAGDGLSMDAITDNSKAVFKIDPEHSVYMPTTPTDENAVPVYAKSSKTWISLPATPSATASSIVTRDANGNLQVGNPVNDADAVPKSFVEDIVPKIGSISQTSKPNLKSISYGLDSAIPTSPEEGVEYAITDLIQSEDLDATLLSQINTIGNKVTQSASTTGSELYGRESGSDRMFTVSSTPSAFTVARYNANGVMKVSDAVADGDAVNLGQLNNGWVKQSNSTVNLFVYSRNAGVEGTLQCAEGVVNGSIPLRDGYGRLYIADAILDRQAVNLKQVTDGWVKKSTNTTLNIVYTKELGVDGVRDFSTNPSSGAFAIWNNDGILKTNTPTTDLDVVNLKYFNEHLPTIAGPNPVVITLDSPDTATEGILTEDQLATLQSSDNASIMFAHKKYYLGGKGHQEGYLTYTHSGYENNIHILESITVTISTRAWVLNATDVLDPDEIKELVEPMIDANNNPTWKTAAPTTEEDKAKVQFTKVTITTADSTHFPGMNGRYTIVPGFTDDGFQYSTVVCMQEDPAYEFPYIGSITSTMASGIVIKASVAPAYVSIADPEVTFSYEYLW